MAFTRLKTSLGIDAPSWEEAAAFPFLAAAFPLAAPPEGIAGMLLTTRFLSVKEDDTWYWDALTEPFLRSETANRAATATWRTTIVVELRSLSSALNRLASSSVQASSLLVPLSEVRSLSDSGVRERQKNKRETPRGGKDRTYRLKMMSRKKDSLQIPGSRVISFRAQNWKKAK